MANAPKKPKRRRKPKPSTLSKRVAARIAAVLKEKGRSLDRLALEAEISKGFLSQFLRGHKDMTLTSLARVAAGLEVDPADLITKK